MRVRIFERPGEKGDDFCWHRHHIKPLKLLSFEIKCFGKSEVHLGLS